jgi:ketosteroid isomerase-like protein
MTTRDTVIAYFRVLHDGREMRAQICSVIVVRDGKIFRQEQYDCFEP